MMRTASAFITLPLLRRVSFCSATAAIPAARQASHALPYSILRDADSQVDVRTWTRGVELERSAEQQLLQLSKLPSSILQNPIAVMPDVHSGIGSTVGTVIPTTGALIPSCVGVDIGCGMVAVKTTLKQRDLPPQLDDLRLEIEMRVPHGRTHNGRAEADAGGWRGDVPDRVGAVWKEHLEKGFRVLCDRQKDIEKTNNVNHLGTLGGGNHFIEVCLDDDEEEPNVWVMLHSGSRGVGNRIGSIYIQIAQKDMGNLLSNLPHADLAYLQEGTTSFSDYVTAVEWAQQYAWWNRQLMLESVLDAMRASIPVPFRVEERAINCHHNYVERFQIPTGDNAAGEQIVWLTRKGATSAREGELAVIPGSMGARSYIARGKGSVDAYCSCSHGAGRRFSRGEAKRRFTLDDHQAATAGVACRKDVGVLDETPAAYKDIDAVMEAQKDLVDVVCTLRQIICVKG